MPFSFVGINKLMKKYEANLKEYVTSLTDKNPHGIIINKKYLIWVENRSR